MTPDGGGEGGGFAFFGVTPEMGGECDGDDAVDVVLILYAEYDVTTLGPSG